MSNTPGSHSHGDEEVQSRATIETIQQAGLLVSVLGRLECLDDILHCLAVSKSWYEASQLVWPVSLVIPGFQPQLSEAGMLFVLHWVQWKQRRRELQVLLKHRHMRVCLENFLNSNWNSQASATLYLSGKADCFRHLICSRQKFKSCLDTGLCFQLHALQKPWCIARCQFVVDLAGHQMPVIADASGQHQ